MFSNSTSSLSDNFFGMNKAELSLGFSFDEKDIKISHSHCSAFSNISTTEEADSLPRKKSKISIQMEELKNKPNEEDDDTQEITEENEFEEEFDFNSKNVDFSKKEEDNSAEFEAYFYFQLNGENEFIFPVKSDSFNKNEQYAYELIKNIIKKLQRPKEDKISRNHSTILKTPYKFELYSNSNSSSTDNLDVFDDILDDEKKITLQNTIINKFHKEVLEEFQN